MLHNFCLIIYPLRYLKIRHISKWQYDYFFPFLFSVALYASISLLPSVKITGEGSLVSNLLDLFQILVGFYITSLAAISTFANLSILDKKFDGQPVQMVIKEKLVNLTRRKFLSFLFGYLSFMSIIVYIYGVIINISLEKNSLITLVQTKFGFEIIDLGTGLIAIFVFLFFNIITTTALGIYYLSYRVEE